jgi:bifunctional non-homologous end joining protein LigD
MKDMEVSNADRMVFPEAGYTKGDVVAHYVQVGEAMLQFVADRPLTLQRFPKGLSGSGFMQKNTPAHYPQDIGRFAVVKRDGGTTTYTVVTNAAHLPYLANQGTITIHMWTSTASRPARPDFMVIDLDPEEDDVAGARNLTRDVGDLLEYYGVASIPMATGSKGYHVWVPLAPGHDWDEIERTGRAIAGILADRFPDRATTEFLKAERAGRVFVDWLRNTRGATVVAPYSLRPRPSAPVAVPVTWEELPSTDPQRWTLATIPDRLENPAPMPPPQTVPTADICDAAETEGVDLVTRFDRFGRTRSD